MEDRNTVVRGSVVRALAGKERDRLYVACRVADRCVYIADGRKRKLDSPKRKNVRHISPSGERIDMTDMTDKKLRRTLRLLLTQGERGQTDPTEAERRD